MKRIPAGISNFKNLIQSNGFYVDKTKYIEQLEKYANNYVYFLRPRKFGKTLFTSTLEYYYGIDHKDEVDILFKDTYIGKNPTPEKSSYHILYFNFSGIDTETEEITMLKFKKEVCSSVELFVQNMEWIFI